MLLTIHHDLCAPSTNQNFAVVKLANAAGLLDKPIAINYLHKGTIK